MSPSKSQEGTANAPLRVDRAPDSGSGVPERLTGYLLFLLLCLALAGFFDSFATSFRYTMLTYVREDFEVAFGSMVNMFTWVYLGSCLSFGVRALADVCGRKMLLWTTMAGLCLLQWILGFTRTPHQYIAVLTLLALFYKSDIWLLVMSEEAPPRHRGLCTALTVAISGSGALALGELIRRMGTATDAWREVARFPIWGLLALVPVLFFMRETRHFTRMKSAPRRSVGWKVLLAPFRRAFLKALVVLSLLKMFFVGGAIVTLALLGTEFLRVDNGFGPAVIGRIVQLEVCAIMAGWLLAGFLSDRIGRHTCLYLFGALYVVALLNLALMPKGSAAVVVAYLGQILAGTAVYAILRVATMELFPNDCRAIGSAWTDLFMTLFAAGTARMLGALTAPTATAAHGVTLSTCIIAIAVLAALVLPWFALLRETRGQKLEEV